MEADQEATRTTSASVAAKLAASPQTGRAAAPIKAGFRPLQPGGGQPGLGSVGSVQVLALQRRAGNCSVAQLLRQATPTAPAAQAPATPADRIASLVAQFHATRDAREQLAIARRVLTEIDDLARDPNADPRIRELLAREKAGIGAQLAAAGASPTKQAGMAAGAVVLAGGGPEDVPADVVAAVVFLGIVLTAATRTRTQVDPGQLTDALDRLKDALREPRRDPDRRRPPLPLGPDLVPPKQERPLHQGNIHVQGDDVLEPPNFAWSQPVPASKAQGLGGLAQIQGQCSPRQLRDRDHAFRQAERFILKTMASAPPPVFRTFQNPEVIDDPRKRTRRVDIEIIRGTAFV